MKKLFFALVFLCSVHMVQAQYMTPPDAAAALNAQAQALENGTATLKNDVTTASLANNPTTITSTTGANGEIPTFENLQSYVYPQVMYKLANEIVAASDTQLGINNAQAFFDTHTNSQDQKAVIDAAMAYAIEIIN